MKPLIHALTCSSLLLCGAMLSGCSGSSGSSTANASTSAGATNGAGGLFGGTTVPIVGPSAQGLGGVYQISGSDPARGAYTGQVELRWQGPGDYAFVREIEFSAFRHGNRPVSVVWSGRASDTATGVSVDLSLDRMGWAAEAPGIGPRTAADGVPMPIHGDFTQAGNDFSGAYSGQGAPFANPSETWTYQGPPGPQPIWESARTWRASHDPPGPVTKAALFTLFSTFHQLPYVQPHVPKPEFQAATYGFIHDRTDFDLHRQRPDLLRVINKLVDPLNLEEAVLKANAYGKKLRTKAEAADLELPQKFLNPTGCLSEVLPGGTFGEENDGCLWTGVYCYSQALRHRTTGEAAALANLERTARSLWTMAAISGRTDEFARTLRAAGAHPANPRWVAGSGQFTGIEWKTGGNNDMFKGLILGGLAIAEEMPATHPLRAEYGATLRGLAYGHSVAQGRKKNNEMMAKGVVSLLTGSAAERDEYKRLARNPLLQAYDIAVGGGFHAHGISDWSGTHLNIVGLITKERLADAHGLTVVHEATKLALRRAARTLSKTRRTIHSLAAAGLGTVSYASPIDTTDALWALRELPFPRSVLGAGQSLRDDFVAGPYPNLPWKNDWVTNLGRAKGIVGVPLFEKQSGSYSWKDAPYAGISVGGPAHAQNSATDLLFAYWLGRAYGQISPAD